MKKIIVGITWMAMLSFTGWETDFQKAQKIAREKDQMILLNFSGSDWCIPCIKMRKEIFDDEAFTRMADTTLVLVNADFPRKKNQLSKTQKEQNEALAEKYNLSGKFPCTLLLTAEGKIIKQWDGIPPQTPAAFAQLIKDISDGNKH